MKISAHSGGSQWLHADLKGDMHFSPPAKHGHQVSQFPSFSRHLVLNPHRYLAEDLFFYQPFFYQLTQDRRQHVI